MTEAEWLTADARRAHDFLMNKSDGRKLRLLACACVRKIGQPLPDRYSRKAVEAGERFADGLISPEKLRAIWGDVRRAVNVSSRRREENAAGIRWLVAALCEPDIARVVTAVMWGTSIAGDLRTLRSAQWPIVCDIFGPCVTIEEPWLMWNHGTVPAIAQHIYEDRAFQDLSILADALEDAGCTDPDILAHCRGGGEHVCGCWVVDLLLGKS